MGGIEINQHNNPVECYNDDTIEYMRGIEINQYNNPVECYNDDTIEEMRDEKIILDHPELAERVKSTQKPKEQVNPMAAQKMKANNYDPRRSAVLMAINAQ